MKATVIIVLLIAGLFTSGKAVAQSKGSIKADTAKINSRSRAMQEYYKGLLKCDEERAGKVSEIMEGYKSELKAVEKDESLSVEGKRARFKAIAENKDKKLKQILRQEEHARMEPLNK